MLYVAGMSAPHLGAYAGSLPLLPELSPRAGEATVAVHDEGDHLAAYLAPAPLDRLIEALASGRSYTAWDPLGAPLARGAVLPAAGEAIDGVPAMALPASLRAQPRSVLAGGHDWVLCVEDGVHATLFARRASLVVRAVHAAVAHLIAPAGPAGPRIDPRLLGQLARPSFRGPHRLRLDAQTGDLWVRSPGRTVALSPDARGSWRILR